MDLIIKTQPQGEDLFTDGKARKKGKKANQEIVDQTQRLKFCG
jgi:hypothetical protein